MLTCRFTAALQELQGDRFEVIFVKEGEFVDGKHYVTREALEKAQTEHYFDNVYVQELTFRDGVQGHLPPHLEPHARGGVFGNAVAITADTTLKILEDGKAALIGFIDAIDETWKNKIRQIAEKGLRLPGVSFNAMIPTANLRDRVLQGGHFIKDILDFGRPLDSLEVVTYPNAGGQILRMVAAEEPPSPTFDRTPLMLKELKQLFEARGISVETTDEMTPLQLVQAAMDSAAFAKIKDAEQEMFKSIEQALEAKVENLAERLVAAVSKMVEEKTETDDPKKDPEPATQEKDKEPVKAALSDVETLITKHLDTYFEKFEKQMEERTSIQAGIALINGSDLSEKAKKLALEQFHLRKKDADTIVNSFRELVKPLDDGRVRASISPLTGIEWGAEPIEKKKIALTRMLGGVPHDDKEKELFAQTKPFTGIPEAFGELTGIWTLSYDQFLQPSRIERRVSAAFDYVDIADFPNLLGNTLNRVIVDLYGEREHSWQELVTIRKGVKNFKALQMNRFGGFGTLEKFTDSNSGRDTNRFNGGIAIVTPDGEQKASYSVDIYANQWVLTYKALRDDDIQALSEWMNKFADACDDTALLIAVTELLNIDASGNINNGTISYDSKALYHADHSNIMTDRISYDAVYNACQKIRMQKSFGASNPTPLHLRPWALIGPESLRREIEVITGVVSGEPQTTGHTKNVISYLKPIIFHDDDLGGSDLNWYVMADPKRNPTVEMAFLDDNQNPTILTQRDPTQGLMFTHLETVFSGIYMLGAGTRAYETVVGSFPEEL